MDGPEAFSAALRAHSERGQAPDPERIDDASHPLKGLVSTLKRSRTDGQGDGLSPR